jgi:hypothetical protein
MRKSYILIILAFVTLKAQASPQMPDILIFGKDTIGIYNLILEQYLHKLDTTSSNQLFGLTFREGASFSCWRGYQAIYQIYNDSLFLTDIITCGELGSGKIDKIQSSNKIKTIFGNKFQDGKVYIDWFYGDIKFPLSQDILRWDGVFYKIFEKEKVISIIGGIIVYVKDVENYIDDPQRINRRYKDKVSDVIFKVLRKAKWKNPNEFDCSNSYLITIDENGLVSNVRMNYTDEEIKKYYEDDEYKFCITKVYEALRTLKFDIIKDQGIPIPEEIFIEIWVKDNWKLENWTQ